MRSIKVVRVERCDQLSIFAAMVDGSAKDDRTIAASTVLYGAPHLCDLENDSWKRKEERRLQKWRRPLQTAHMISNRFFGASPSPGKVYRNVKRVAQCTTGSSSSLAIAILKAIETHCRTRWWWPKAFSVDCTHACMRCTCAYLDIVGQGISVA